MTIRECPSIQAIVGPGGKVDPHWQRWFGDLARAVNSTPASTPAPAVEYPSFVINGAGSVTADGAVAAGEFSVTLVGDKDSPPLTSFYGADSAGEKGFVPLYDGLEEGTGIALRDSGYIVIDTVASPDDLPLTGNTGEAVRVTESEVGIYAWDGSAFTLDTAATGVVSVTCDATAAEIPYDNATSGLAATDTQDAVDELAAMLAAGSPLSLVGTATVAGSAATTLTLSGLDLATDGRYVMYMVAKNATLSNAVLSLYYNADTTDTNYWRQAFNANNTTVSASRGNDAAIVTLVSSVDLSGKVEIAKDISGSPRANASFGRDAPASIRIDMTAHAWTSTANVTGITITSSVANSLAVGSYFKVYKVV